MSDRTRIEEIIVAAESRLKTARFGLEDMRRGPARLQSGLMNAVVFGRTVTFVLQNLRGVAADFDEWYKPIQDEMRADPLMKYFVELRNSIEKSTGGATGSAAHIISLGAKDWARFEPRPPNAVGQFINDKAGGSGWEVQQPDGSIEKYYIDMPPTVVKTFVHLPDAPDEFRGILSADLVEMYLQKLETVAANARKRFLG